MTLARRNRCSEPSDFFPAPRIASRRPDRRRNPFAVAGEEREPNGLTKLEGRLNSSSFLGSGCPDRPFDLANTEESLRPFRPFSNRVMPLLSPNAGAMQVGACTFARLRPRPTFPRHPAKGGAFGSTEVLSTVRNQHTAGIAPSFAGRASRSRHPDEGCGNRENPRLCYLSAFALV